MYIAYVLHVITGRVLTVYSSSTRDEYVSWGWVQITGDEYRRRGGRKLSTRAISPMKYEEN